MARRSARLAGKPKPAYFKSGTRLNERQQAFCRCEAHVSKSAAVYNPYAVCAKSTGTTTPCWIHYNFDRIPDDELRGLARLHKVRIPSPYSRSKTIAAMRNK